MIRFLFRWFWRAVLALVAGVALLLLPVGYVELACNGSTIEDNYAPVITDPNWQRDESRTLTTYPEWHIVHAYDDYAKVISDGDPHDFGYLRAVTGFWTSLCPLKEKSAEMGGMTGDQKMTIYTIGVSFTAELLAKAAYEETLGRMSTIVRGPERSTLDNLSANRAAEYARFLQQTPWYQWPFSDDVKILENEGDDSFRDRERRFALGNEAAAKSAYANVIAQAVAGVGADELRMRSFVSGLSELELSNIEGVDVIGARDGNVEIETPRYRRFTRIVEEVSSLNGNFVEIAGNDDILFTALSDEAANPEALCSFPRQVYGDYRHLFVTKVDQLSEKLRNMAGTQLEHIHDY